MAAGDATCRSCDTAPSTEKKVSLSIASIISTNASYLIGWVPSEDTRRAEVVCVAVVVAEVA